MLILNAAARLDKRLFVSLLTGSLAGVQEEASPLANATFRFDRSAHCSKAQTQTALVLARLRTTQTPHSLSAAVTQRTLCFLFFFVAVQLKMSNLAALAETNEGVGWGECGASRRLSSRVAHFHLRKCQGRIASVFLTCLKH